MHNDEAFRGGNTGAVLVAAGSGSRAGGEIPKQFQPLRGKPVLVWSLEAMLRCEEIAAVAVVISKLLSFSKLVMLVAVAVVILRLLSLRY